MIRDFNEVTTAYELVIYTRSFGIPVNTESICRMQDIFGHTSVQDLAELANDRDNGMQTMNIIFTIWHWEEATRFYNTYVNKVYMDTQQDLKEMTADCIAWKEKAEAFKADLEKAREAAKDNKRILEEAAAEADTQRKRADAAEAEIMKLKAMLFDYMVKAGA